MNKPGELLTEVVEVRAETLIFVGPIGDGMVTTIQSIDIGKFGIRHFIFVEKVSDLFLIEHSGVIVYCHSNNFLEQAAIFCRSNNLPLIASKNPEYSMSGYYPVIAVSGGELSRLGKLSDLMVQAKKLGAEFSIVKVITGATAVDTDDYRNTTAEGLLKLVQIIRGERRKGKLLVGAHKITDFITLITP